MERSEILKLITSSSPCMSFQENDGACSSEGMGREMGIAWWVWGG